jgi:hypothetical protein
LQELNVLNTLCMYWHKHSCSWQYYLLWAFFCNYNYSVNNMTWTDKYVAAYCNLFRETTAIYWQTLWNNSLKWRHKMPQSNVISRSNRWQAQPSSTSSYHNIHAMWCKYWNCSMTETGINTVRYMVQLIHSSPINW